MYIAFADESSHTAAEKFTVCGLTAIKLSSAAEISKNVKEIRSDSLSPEQSLKWTLPEGWTSKDHGEIHRKLKERIMAICAHKNVHFFGYVHFNEDRSRNDPERNAKFGFNTLLAALDRWLSENGDFATVVFDRMDWQGSFEYCSEKFTKGLIFPPNRDQPNIPLPRLLSFSMASSRMSDLCTLNDVYTGALNYVANVQHNAQVGEALIKKLSKAFVPSVDGTFTEKSFFQRPLDKAKLSPEVSKEYTGLAELLRRASQ